jgi:hypothetical protein
MVGSKIAQRSKPAAREGTTLIIIVASPLWANELSLLQTTILKRVQSKLPGVQTLRFQIGRIEPGREAPVQPRIKPAPLPQDLEQRLAGLEDTHLRETIRTAAAHQLAVAQLRLTEDQRQATQGRAARPSTAGVRRTLPPTVGSPKR